MPKPSIIAKCVRLAHNAVLDFRFGGTFLGGTIKSRYSHLGARDTCNTDYGTLTYIFGSLKVTGSDVLVDVGCGKGRVINWWLCQGMTNRTIGIEIDEQIAVQTRRRLRQYQNVEIICGNILDVLPVEGTIFYLYNPFSESVMRQFENILMSRGGNAKVIYFNPVHAQVFLNNPRWLVTPIVLPASQVHVNATALLIELVPAEAQCSRRS